MRCRQRYQQQSSGVMEGEQHEQRLISTTSVVTTSYVEDNSSPYLEFCT
ncbi:unnamed protein product [Onchocerca flexuosa]|uniref:Uncharacterized protein n=1 Tax=Onchocerca flexuosa TaxID=387005 RepID=A0A183H404_9BILA|nr:unnamed protein product [Onchocerca flexuosa]